MDAFLHTLYKCCWKMWNAMVRIQLQVCSGCYQPYTIHHEEKRLFMGRMPRHRLSPLTLVHQIHRPV